MMKNENLALNRIENIFNLIKNDFSDISSISKKAYNYEFSVQNGKENLKIQVYFGKNGLKEVLQGSKQTNLYYAVCNLLGIATEKISIETSEPLLYIGSDESGKGDFFGPLVIASVVCDKELSGKLKLLGVKDSKELSDNQIKIIANNIISLLVDKFSYIVLEPIVYNKLYQKYGNLNKLLNAGHSKNIGDLLIKFRVDEIIVDKFAELKLSLEKETSSDGIKFRYETKAEKYIAVAAASIIARFKFIEWFENPANAKFALPKGAGKEVDYVAKKIKKEFGEFYLNNFAKLHFKTLKKI